MSIVHTQIIGSSLKSDSSGNAVPSDDLYSIDIECRDPRLLQYLAMKLKMFLNDPRIDAEVTRILEEKTDARKSEKPVITGEWIEEYGHKMSH